MKLYHGQAVSKHGSTKHNAKLFSIVTLHLDLSVNCNFEPGTFHGRNNFAGQYTLSLKATQIGLLGTIWNKKV